MKINSLITFPALLILVHGASAAKSSRKRGKRGDTGQPTLKATRRLLGTDGDTTSWETAWDAEKELCIEQEYYPSIYVDSHMYFVANPTQKATALGCKAIALHDSIGAAQGSSKQVHVFPINNNGAVVDSYPLSVSGGTIKLADIASAFDNAKSTAGSEYDILHNNCGTFILSMGELLGISAYDEGALAYTATRLTDSGVIAQMIREDEHTAEDLGISERCDNEEEEDEILAVLDDISLVEALLHSYMEEHAAY